MQSLMRIILINLRSWLLPAMFLALCLGGAYTAPLTMGAEASSTVRQTAAGSEWNWLGTVTATIGIAAAVALAWAVRKFYFRREQAMRNDPRQLLRELCQAHGLSRRAERLLRRAALELGTQHAGRLFLEPKLLLGRYESQINRPRSRAILQLRAQTLSQN